MSSSKRVPASIRYLKPKLKALTRPGFWISATILGLVLLFIWEVWSNPQWLSGDQGGSNKQEAKDKASDKPLSPDDVAAIGADIDNLPALMQEFTGKSASAKKKSSEKAKPEGFYDQMMRQQAAAQALSAPKVAGVTQQAPQTSNNPFGLYPQDSSSIGLMPNANSRLMSAAPNNMDATRGAISPVDFNTLPANQQNSASVRALQQVLDQNPATSTVPAQGSANASGQTSVNTPTFTNSVVPPQTSGYSTNTGYNNQPTQTINNAPNPYIYPNQSVPVAPVVPVAPSNYGQYPTVPQVPVQTGGFNNNPTFNSNLNNTGVPQPQLSQPSNLSNTRRIGRTIGGGQINTFSNP